MLPASPTSCWPLSWSWGIGQTMDCCSCCCCCCSWVKERNWNRDEHSKRFLEFTLGQHTHTTRNTRALGCQNRWGAQRRCCALVRASLSLTHTKKPSSPLWSALFQRDKKNIRQQRGMGTTPSHFIVCSVGTCGHRRSCSPKSFYYALTKTADF
jgi:hypothetical protein